MGGMAKGRSPPLFSGKKIQGPGADAHVSGHEAAGGGRWEGPGCWVCVTQGRGRGLGDRASSHD